MITSTLSWVWVNGRALKYNRYKEVKGFSFCSTDVDGVYFDLDTLDSPVESLNLHPVAEKVKKSTGFSAGSVWSETYSSHRLATKLDSLFGSKIVKDVETEGEINYKCRGAMTDYGFQFSAPFCDVEKLSVEVKRLSSFRGYNVLTQTFVNNLLDKANRGSIESNNNVDKSSRWDAQILHVLTDDEKAPDMVKTWANKVEDTGFCAVVVTLVLGNTDFMFKRN